MTDFIPYSDAEASKYEAATRFVEWLEERAIVDARGDELTFSAVNPTGRFWLGRLGPKDVVTRQDQRGDRLEPCAIGLRMATPRIPIKFSAKVQFYLWLRERATGGEHTWQWRKSDALICEVQVLLDGWTGERTFGSDLISASLKAIGAETLAAEVRVSVTLKTSDVQVVEVTFVNVGPEVEALADGRLFECSLTISGITRIPFELEALPDSFRFNRRVEAFGINCGAEVEGGNLRTSDAPAKSRYRPRYWSASSPCPDLKFETLAQSPVEPCEALLHAFGEWAKASWSEEALKKRAEDEHWSPAMIEEAELARRDFTSEQFRVASGVRYLKEDSALRTAFSAMNEAMKISAKGKYDSWRPFQIAFLLANLRSIVEPEKETDIVDIVWFATGGGKTETYLGLLITAAILDRMRGKLSGITAWSRFPLRMLSLQQTQRFANALAAAEIVRKGHELPGDPFSLGFLVGGSATPNRIKKESKRAIEDADKISELVNPFRLLEVCPFCRNKGVTTKFDRRTWRLVHLCAVAGCASEGNPLPIFVIDDEIWRFLPTIVVGTLDKAANIARQTGMRGLVGFPWGMCSKPGHGYTYATRKEFPTGCLVPDCKGVAVKLPMEGRHYAPTFRLQDELHLLRDSLGAVDAHYEAALDGIQRQLTGSVPKILASSATLSGYKKQVDVLYNRSARVFPQPPPNDGAGFWTSDSSALMRRYIALAPRRLTVEFVVDRLIVTLQSSIRELLTSPDEICEKLRISPEFVPFLVDIYGTNVVYGNTLKDIDAVIRSADTQYSDLSPPANVDSLTGRTGFDNIRAILDRLEHREPSFRDRIHIIAASSMMSHGVDIDRLNVMVMLALPLGVAEFIQATARVGRRWPAFVVVVPKMTRERDASVYRSFPEFISHGDRFVEPIPITRKSRQVLQRTIAGLEMARVQLIHEPEAHSSLALVRAFNSFVKTNSKVLDDDLCSIARDLGFSDNDELLNEELKQWFERFSRNLQEPPADTQFLSQISPTGDPMTSLRDVEEQAPIYGDSSQ